MSTGLLRSVAIDEICRQYSLDYADTAARTGASPSADDVGRIARQLDDDTFWLLRDHDPLTWVQIGVGGGDVTGPSSATDNALARFDSTTGKLIQNSTATLDDSGNVVFTGTVTANSAVLLNALPGHTKTKYVDPAATAASPDGTIQKPYTTIAAAIAAASAGDLILLLPGVHMAAPFTIPAGVAMKGSDKGKVVIYATNNSAHLITMAADATYGSAIECVTIMGPTSAGYACVRSTSSTNPIFVNQIDFGAGGIGIESATTSYGRIVAEQCKFFPDVTIGVKCSGAQGRFDCNGQLMFATTMFQADQGTIWIHNSGGIGNTVGLHTLNGGKILPHSLTLDGVTTAIHLEDSTDEIKGNTVVARNTVTTDILQDTSGGVVSLTASRFDGKFDIADWDDLALNFDQTLLGGEVNIVGIDLHVGFSESGKRCILGQPPTLNLDDMKCFRNTNQEVGTWSDITTELQSPTGSTADVFPGTGSGNCFYIGSNSSFTGHYMNISTAGIVGTGALICEYWDGSSWEELKLMAADSATPHEQYGENIAELEGELNLRFASLSDHATKSLNGTTRYWVRYRITAAWTSVPAAQQAQIVTNNTQVATDGFVEYFGSARSERYLPWHLGLLEDAYGRDPANERVRYSTNVDISLVDNEFNDGVWDGRAAQVEIPFGLDTSHPLIFRLIWAQNGTSTGDVELLLHQSKAQAGDVFSSGLGETLTSDITTISTGQDNKSYELELEIDVSDMVPGDLLGLAISRDARSSNLDDTLSNSVYMVSTSLKGIFWR